MTAMVLRGLPSRGASADLAAGGGPPSTGAEDRAGCLVCGDTRPPLALLHGDRFCTTRCARAFYGCPIDPATERKPRREIAA